MAQRNVVQYTISVDSKYSRSQLEEIGRRAVEVIRTRTQRGLDKDNRSFARYNQDYAREKGQTLVDLTDTSSMLTDLDVISVSPGRVASKIIVGYATDNPEAEKVEGNILGTYGQSDPIPGKARKFLGLSQSEKDRILAQIESDSPQRSATDRFIQGLLARVVNGDGDGQ